MSAAFLKEAFADHTEQASSVSIPQPLLLHSDYTGLLGPSRGQAFAHAVPDAHKPFLPPVYLLSAYSSLSSQLSPCFLWKSGSPPFGHALSVCAGPFLSQHLSQCGTGVFIGEVI